MNPINLQQVARNISQSVQLRLPARITSKLTFKDPDQITKGGVKRWRARILPLRTNSIFNSSWCSFEVNVHDTGGGSVGFFCYTKNKRCGNGVHSEAVFNIISDFCKLFPSFESSDHDDSIQGVYLGYIAMSPTHSPADDLANLIIVTLPQFESLLVTVNDHK